MRRVTSTHASNVDVHWLTLTKEDVLKACALLGVQVPEDARFELYTEDPNAFLCVDWQTPKLSGK